MNSFTSRLILSTALANVLFLSSYAIADNAQQMDPVVVIATRVPTPVSEVASSVTLITSDDIDTRQQKTLPQVLQSVPGLNLVMTGNPGSKATVYMRGTNSNHTKVLVDGIDVSDLTSPDGAFDLSQILAADIERVEVLRGPQSGLYGSDAIGGVINVITKKGKGPAHYTGSLEAGSFSTFNQTAGVSGSQDRFSYTFNAQHYYAGNIPVTPKYLVPANRPRSDDSYDNKTVSTKLGANLTDTLDVGLVARYVETVLHTTTDDATGPEVAQSRSDNRDLFTRATAHLVSFDGRLSQTLGLAYTDYRRRFLDPNTGNFDLELNEGDRIKADWQGDITLMKGQTLTLGAEHQVERILGDSPYSAQTTNNAVSAQLQSSMGERFFNTVSIRNDDNDRFGNKSTYRVAPAFVIKETGTKLKASMGTGFKAPTMDALFHDYPAFFFYANPNLKPETSKGYDIGFEQALFGKRVEFGSTYFHNAIKNLIASNDSFSSSINIGRATTYGFESFVSYKPVDTLTFRLDHTFTIANDDVKHQRLLRRPKHKLTLNTDWQASDKLSLSGSVVFVGSWLDPNRNYTVSRLSTSSYTTVNLAAEYAVSEVVSVFGRITNLLNRHYQSPVGFEQQGIGAFAGIKTSF